MNNICLIDTSVFLNILDVPSKNSDREEVFESFETYTKLGCEFIIPVATIIETGNHIAQNGDGNTRRQVAQDFYELLEKSYANEAPFIFSSIFSNEQLREWIALFPDHAGRNKSPQKITEGTSLGDLTIIKEFEMLCELHPRADIFIWSLDCDLKIYIRDVKKIGK